MKRQKKERRFASLNERKSWMSKGVVWWVVEPPEKKKHNIGKLWSHMKSEAQQEEHLRE